MTFQYDLSSAVFLDSGVHVADERLDVADDLALERRDQAQHSVGRRVVRTDVERQQLVGLAAGHRLGGVSDRLLPLAIVLGQPRHQRSFPYELSSLKVNRTGSPPTGKSRRCGKPW